MPIMTKGSQATDGNGNLMLTQEEKDELLKKYPEVTPFVKSLIGAKSFINNEVRFCLWLKDASPKIYGLPPIKNRLEKVKASRLKSPTKSVQKQANTPYLFTQIRQPTTNYLVIPRFSSGRRIYLPMGFMHPDTIANDKVNFIPNATLFMFGVMSSIIHNSWMRVVSGRLKSDYGYSPAVYNNFPWLPDITKEQKDKISKTAQAILDARSLYPDCSLAVLYDDITMPQELRKAHEENDKAVMDAYGLDYDLSEHEIVQALMDLYVKQFGIK